jgi:hypothetical protein
MDILRSLGGSEFFVTDEFFRALVTRVYVVSGDSFSFSAISYLAGQLGLGQQLIGNDIGTTSVVRPTNFPAVSVLTLDSGYDHWDDEDDDIERVNFLTRPYSAESSDSR